MKKDEYCIIGELCDDLGLDAKTEFLKLKRSIFSEYIAGEDPRTALIAAEVVRMWIASMVSRDDVKAGMREVYDQIRQVGTYELREAWDVSELPMDSFNEMLLNGGTNKESVPQQLLH
jgi:hypothetical protein